MLNLFKKLRPRLPRIFCLTLCLIVLISVPCTIFSRTPNAGRGEEMAVFTIWQVDSFEGGRGSRADFLQTMADEFSDERIYFTVTAISAAAARENLQNGTAPDLISYGAGTYGIESYIRGYTTWCHGGYCLLTLDENADFTDATAQNTVVNAGIDNLSGAAALLCGLNGAVSDRPTGAYVKLLGGKYRYLLGTQRDIFRLKTRGVAFSVLPITQFNDLYQNISIVTTDPDRAYIAQKYVDFLTEHAESVRKLGLMADGKRLYDDELSNLEELSYEFRLISPVSSATRTALEQAVSTADINLLKNLLI